MKKIIFICVAAMMLCVASAYTAAAQSMKTIRLQDGSLLRGDLIKVENGIYTIETKNLGTFQLKESSIAGITTGHSPRVRNQRPAMQGQQGQNQQTLQDLWQGQSSKGKAAQTNPQNLQGLQQNLSSTLSQMPPEAKAMQGMLLSDPQLMQDIQNLSKDPEIQALMMDPALMQSILSGDVKALEQSEEVDQLMNNPKMKKLINKFNRKVNSQR
jgi:hypothetical protein